MTIFIKTIKETYAARKQCSVYLRTPLLPDTVQYALIQNQVLQSNLRLSVVISAPTSYFPSACYMLQQFLIFRLSAYIKCVIQKRCQCLILISVCDISEDEYGSKVDDTNRDLYTQNMFRCHFVHNKSPMYSPRIETGSLP